MKTVTIPAEKLEQLRTTLVQLVDSIDQMLEEAEDTPVSPVPEDPQPDRDDWRCYLDRYPGLLAYASENNIPDHALPSFARRHYDRFGKHEGKVWGCLGDQQPDSQGRRPFHHYNPQAWTSHGAHPPQGVALVLGPDQHAVSVSLDGRAMQKHGSEDRGREVWTIRNAALVGSGGEVVLTESGGDRYQFTVAGGSEMDRGEYWRA